MREKGLKMTNKDELIKHIGEVVYNTLNDATLGKHKGAKEVLVPIDITKLINDGGPLVVYVKVKVPPFVYVHGPNEDKEFNGPSLDEYLWLQGK